MIIALAGDAGSGKSTVARLVAKKLGYKHYSVGDFMREIARKRGKTLLQISKLAESDSTIDEELDDMQITLGKEEDNFILDSRLGWHFIPKAFKVFLKVDMKEAAQRIFNDKRHAESENETLAATLANIKKRKSSELKRYKEYYKLNPYDDKHYNLIIDTTGSTSQITADKLLEAVNKK